MLGVPRNGVSLENHNEDWAHEFQKAKKLLQEIHRDNIVDIQHIGSTVIKGIMAKPLLDIAIMFKDISAINLKECRKMVMNIAVIQEFLANTFSF